MVFCVRVVELMTTVRENQGRLLSSIKLDGMTARILCRIFKITSDNGHSSRARSPQKSAKIIVTCVPS